MKQFFNFILILLPFIAQSQIRVENIKNDKDVLTFLKFHYFKSEEVNIDYYQNDVFRNRDSEDSVLNYFDANYKYKWIKIDLNKDGKLDLIWNGCINKMANVLAFISTNKNGYIFELISDEIEENAFHIIKPYKKDGFILTRIDAENGLMYPGYHFKDRFRYDTIAFRNETFVEYNTLNKHYSIDTITITQKAMFPSAELLKVCKDGKIIYSDKLYIDSGYNSFTSIKLIEKDTLTYLFSILNNLPYYSLKEKYNYVAGNLKDGGTKYFEFIFSDGTRQKLSYYYRSAPFGLNKVYDLIMKIKKDGQWILESEKFSRE